MYVWGSMFGSHHSLRSSEVGLRADVVAEEAVGMLELVATVVNILPIAGKRVLPLPKVSHVALAPLLLVADLFVGGLVLLLFVLRFPPASLFLTFRTQLGHAQRAPERRIQRCRVPLWCRAKDHYSRLMWRRSVGERSYLLAYEAGADQVAARQEGEDSQQQLCRPWRSAESQICGWLPTAGVPQQGSQC